MNGAMEFRLGDILSITTGLLVSPTCMDGVYAILNYMTGDNLFTHQLIRAQRECEKPLLAQHPDLAAVKVPEELGSTLDWEAWLEGQCATYGRTRPVAPLAAEDHTRIDPMTELRIVAPHARVIPVVIDPDGAS